MNDPLPDDLAGLEAELRAVRPVAPAPGFADRVAVEARLRAVSPRPPSPGFADRAVAAAGWAGPRAGLRFPRLLRFPVAARAALGAAAALALAALITPAWRAESPGPAAGRPVARVAPRPVSPAPARLWAVADDGSVLPVVNLSDGRAYRPRVRRAEPAPTDFRAMPGAVMPVSWTAAPASLEYSPVEYE